MSDQRIVSCHIGTWTYPIPVAVSAMLSDIAGIDMGSMLTIQKHRKMTTMIQNGDKTFGVYHIFYLDRLSVDCFPSSLRFSEWNFIAKLGQSPQSLAFFLHILAGTQLLSDDQYSML